MIVVLRREPAGLRSISSYDGNFQPMPFREMIPIMIGATPLVIAKRNRT